MMIDSTGGLLVEARQVMSPNWDERPEGTAGSLRYPGIDQGLLYANTFTFEPRVPTHLYCWSSPPSA